MNANTPERLIFWHFFHQIEKELSYERWIDKYRDFVIGLTGGHVPYDDDWVSFRQFCKFLYLQEHRDEARFDEILDKAIAIEQQTLLDFLIKKQAEAPPKASLPKTNIPTPEIKLPAQKQEDGAATKKNKSGGKKKDKGGEQKLPEDAKRFFHPFLGENDPVEEVSPLPAREIYLHTDEYFSVTRRQMVKAWHYLRRREKRGESSNIDIQATVRKIAQDGMFLAPVMYAGEANRQDTLLIFADQRGSMAPFHEFTRRLIHTARTEGGHPNAPVYYFQNYPVGKVYRQANLSDPIKIKEALLKANRHATMAIIISDAGAARGNPDEERHKIRLEMVNIFLDYLRENVAHTIWLNPIPKHRWDKTAAQRIEKEAKITVMSPVFDAGDGNDFQSTIRLLFKQKRSGQKK